MPKPEKIMVFDTETTGVNIEEARIVTAFIGIMDSAGQMIERYSWIINPGIEIPTEASDVHGVTTERARAEGRTDIGKALFEIATKLDYADRWNIPLVVMNAPFDLSLMDRELRRHCNYKHFRAPKVVLDPLVLDKHVDKYRRGKRQLTFLADNYNVPVEENAHDAEADCRMCGRVALKLLAHPDLTNLPLARIHALQIPAKAEQAAGLEDYFRKKQVKDIADEEVKKMRKIPIEKPVDRSEINIEREWPMIPFAEKSMQ
jgi:DNA polymerase-3 subunit epsilon